MDETVHSRRKPGVASLASAGLKQRAAVRAAATARPPQPSPSAARAPVRSRQVAKAPTRADAPGTSRTNDPARTMAGILEVATHEFAEKGLSGARIDEIAAATRTSKRMIYYYFGNKEGLYLAVLEEAYRRMRSIEAELHLEDLPPLQALETLVGFTFDHHQGNPDFIRLVMSENIERGSYLAQSTLIQQLNVPAIGAIDKLYARGVEAGVFRAGLDPIDLHASISALTFFNVSNQYTFGLIFKHDGQTQAALAARRKSVVEMISRFVSR
ncbi:MAG: TetR/AcrR family transcriptional regulator [Pseudomonadota bacterium]